MIRRRVGILVFPEVEVLDFCGPFEVLSATRLDEDRRREEPSPDEVILVAESPGVSSPRAT
jgi:putative intracellular protease/amidase